MAKKRKRARLIYNPTSGQEIMKKHVAEVLDIVENAGFETSAFQTTATPNSARDEAKRAAKTGFDLIIAAGGDGTINEVVNGIAPLYRRPRMAIIPTGTTNDFARALKIPRGNPVAAAKVIAKNQIIHKNPFSSKLISIFYYSTKFYSLIIFIKLIFLFNNYS